MAMPLSPLTLAEVPIDTALVPFTVLLVPNTEEPAEFAVAPTLSFEPTTWMLSPQPAVFGAVHRIVVAEHEASCCR